jgi:hypothetical protein
MAERRERRLVKVDKEVFWLFRYTALALRVIGLVKPGNEESAKAGSWILAAINGILYLVLFLFLCYFAGNYLNFFLSIIPFIVVAEAILIPLLFTFGSSNMITRLIEENKKTVGDIESNSANLLGIIFLFVWSLGFLILYLISAPVFGTTIIIFSVSVPLTPGPFISLVFGLFFLVTGISAFMNWLEVFSNYR